MPRTLNISGSISLASLLACAFGIFAAHTATAQNWAPVATVSPSSAMVTNSLCISDGKDLVCDGSGGLITTSGTLSIGSIGVGNLAAGNISTTSHISATGNISANKFIGDGSGLTNISASSISGLTSDRITSGTTGVYTYTNTSASIATAGVERVVIGTQGYVGIGQQPVSSVALSTSGTSYFNGHVGIGTSTPYGNLHIVRSGTAISPTVGANAFILQNASTAAAGANLTILGGNTGSNFIFFGDTDQSNMGAIAYDNSTDAMKLSVNAIEALRITSSSRVGIGTTAPSATLTVSGSTFTNSLQLRELAGTQPSGYQGGLWSSSGTAVYYNAGNVGIGTSTPATTLDVAGAVTSYQNDSWNNFIGTMYSDTKHPSVIVRRARGTSTAPSYPVDTDILGTVSFRNYAASNGASMNSFATENHSSTASGASLRFTTVPNGNLNPQTRMLIDQNGYVGIGTSTPHNNLVISGAGFTGLSVISTQSGSDPYIQLSDDASSVNTGWSLREDTSNANVFEIRYENQGKFRQTTTGNVTILGASTNCTIGNGTGTTSCTSDRRLKTNIQPLQNSLEKIIALQGVSFDWKKSGEHTIGVIAQDVEKQFPEVVTTDTETGMKSVAYASLVAPLIEAVKEQQNQIDALKHQNQRLEAAILQLQQRVKESE